MIQWQYLDHNIITWSSFLGFIDPALNHIIAYLHHVLNTGKIENRSHTVTKSLETWVSFLGKSLTDISRKKKKRNNFTVLHIYFKSLRQLVNLIHLFKTPLQRWRMFVGWERCIKGSNERERKGREWIINKMVLK